MSHCLHNLELNRFNLVQYIIHNIYNLHIISLQKRPPDNAFYVKTCSKNPKKTKWWYHGG